MNFETIDIAFARELDAKDELARFRDKFVIDDPNVIYLDGNSLGRAPKKTADFMKDRIDGWGKEMLGLYREWMPTHKSIGDSIAKLIGAQQDEVIVTDGTTTNLFKLAVAALRARPERTKIVSDVFNFPSDLYVFQGIVDMLGNKHKLHLIPSEDSVHISPEAIDDAIDEDTVLVSLSHVAFKSAFMYDMASVTEKAHKAGALMLWDLCHSTGAVPVDLNGCNVDLAVGCSYKYLNGGPGAPAYLYVRKDLQDQLVQPIWGWQSDKRPFDFKIDFKPAPNISRYKIGTIPSVSIQAMRPALDIFDEADINELRAKSIQQTEYMIYLVDQLLSPLGFTLGSPRQAEARGSHVAVRHPESLRITRAMSDSPPPAVKVIPDFRTPDNIRIGVTPLYTTYEEINLAIKRIKTIVEEKLYEQYSTESGWG